MAQGHDAGGASGQFMIWGVSPSDIHQIVEGGTKMEMLNVDTHLFNHVKLGTQIRDRLWLLMQREIDPILDEFYDLLQQTPYRSFIENKGVQHLKSRQISHWHHIITHGTDEEYRMRVRAIHQTHQKIGLSIQHYITAYMYLLNRFEKTILGGSSGPKEAFAMISALHAIFAEDIAEALKFHYL